MPKFFPAKNLFSKKFSDFSQILTQSNNKKWILHVRHCLLYASTGFIIGLSEKLLVFFKFSKKSMILSFYIECTPCARCGYKLRLNPIYVQGSMVQVVLSKKLSYIWIRLIKPLRKSFMQNNHPVAAAPANPEN